MNAKGMKSHRKAWIRRKDDSSKRNQGAGVGVGGSIRVQNPVLGRGFSKGRSEDMEPQTGRLPSA